ncbi:MAG: BT_3928 family protein [Bacteroidota bacterium]
MKYVRVISRIILGIVFIFSGFVKVVDPLGSAYKFSDYFNAFRLGFLDGLALPLGIFLSAFELVLGITLILGYRRRIVYWVLMWFMLFFTLLTFILALFNPVSDCGCFGDALILTNWQTFLKNVILMLFVLTLYFNRKLEADTDHPWKEWMAVICLFAGVVWFSVWNHNHLPLLDFRPYDVGTTIQDEMGIPEGAPVDLYESTLIYRNKESGKRESFSIEDYPRDTLLWEFESSESKLVKKGYEPPIHDFAIMDEYGMDLVDEIVTNTDYSLLMISYDLSKAEESGLINARDWSQLEILADDFTFYAVTASPTDLMESISSSLGLGYEFLAADEIMLKTIVRSNPGFLLLKNGSIIGKWGNRDFPSIEELDPGWPELIGNASAPMDEESQMLMEAGIYEEFSFDVLDFDRFIPALVFEKEAKNREGNVVVIFIMGVVVFLLLSRFISPIKL